MIKTFQIKNRISYCFVILLIPIRRSEESLFRKKVGNMYIKLSFPFRHSFLYKYILLAFCQISDQYFWHHLVIKIKLLECKYGFIFSPVTERTKHAGVLHFSATGSSKLKSPSVVRDTSNAQGRATKFTICLYLD